MGPGVPGDQPTKERSQWLDGASRIRRPALEFVIIDLIQGLEHPFPRLPEISFGLTPGLNPT